MIPSARVARRNARRRRLRAALLLGSLTISAVAARPWAPTQPDPRPRRQADDRPRSRRVG